MIRRFLVGCRLFTGDAMLDGHGLLIEDGAILDVLPATAVVAAETLRLPDDSLLVPGFVDTQVNGAGGVLFNDDPTVDAALAIARTLRRTGTVALLPTFITDERGRTEQAARAALAAAALPGSGVLGVHLEGPFLSPERPGVHEPRFIRTPDDDDLTFLTGLAAAPAARLLVTLAPECVADEALTRLVAGGVILSAGHSAASLERVAEAVDLGLRGVTHLFNAMPPIVNRTPGLALAGISDPRLWCGVIADGVHVHPALLRLAVATKPPGRVFLVTDAMPPVGTDAATFELYGRRIFRRDGRLETADGTLAGADIDMIGAVRNAVFLLGLPLEEALRMASLYPATFLGVEDRYGRLAPGHRAALALLGPDLDVLRCWV